MKQKQLKLIAFFLLGFELTGIQAQEVITTAGGKASGSGGTVSYSVGQVVCHTHATTYGSVAEGVQQPYEISVINGLDNTNGINITVLAFPNPVTDNLNLTVDKFDITDLSYQLYDMQGNLLQSYKIESNHTSIDMNPLVPATYFVRVIKNNTEIKTFKIIKTQ